MNPTPFRALALALALLLGAGVFAFAAQPTTQPADNPALNSADNTVDWLLAHSTTAPAIDPTTAPISDAIPATLPAVLNSPLATSDPARPGELLLSDGGKLFGRFSTTFRQPIRLWDPEKNQYNDLPFSLIRSIAAHVVWERQEREWKFSQSGSDIKEYSGKTYPARQTTYTITLKDGAAFTGDVAAPLYLDNAAGERQTYILHRTDKGAVGQTIGQLVYVKSVQFTD